MIMYMIYSISKLDQYYWSQEKIVYECSFITAYDSKVYKLLPAGCRYHSLRLVSANERPSLNQTEYTSSIDSKNKVTYIVTL